VIHDDIHMTFFRFRHRSHCIHDELSDFVIDSQCWIWSPIWSPNNMTLCQFRHNPTTLHFNISSWSINSKKSYNVWK
jgi:hypothetical protein